MSYKSRRRSPAFYAGSESLALMHKEQNALYGYSNSRLREIVKGIYPALNVSEMDKDTAIHYILQGRHGRKKLQQFYRG